MYIKVVRLGDKELQEPAGIPKPDANILLAMIEQHSKIIEANRMIIGVLTGLPQKVDCE